MEKTIEKKCFLTKYRNNYARFLPYILFIFTKVIIKYSLFWLFCAKFVTKYNKTPQSRARNLWLILGEKALYNPLYLLCNSPLHGNLKACTYTVLNHSATVFQKLIIRQVSEIVHRLVEMWD